VSDILKIKNKMEGEMIPVCHFLVNDLNLIQEKDFSIKSDHLHCLYCNKTFAKHDTHTLRTHFESKRHANKKMTKVDQVKNAIQSAGIEEHTFFDDKNTMWGCRLCNDKDATRQFGTGGGQIKKHHLYHHPEKKREREQQEIDNPYLEKRIKEEAEKRIANHSYIDKMISEGFFEEQIEQWTKKLLKK
jgi:hypothetical protein